MFINAVFTMFRAHREIIVFLLVGGLATLSHYCVAISSVFFMGLSLQVANIMGFGAGFVVSYLGHALLTFRSQITAQSFVRFILLAACNYGLSTLLLFVFSVKFELDYRVAFFLVVSILPVVSFFLGKYFVFQKAV